MLNNGLISQRAQPNWISLAIPHFIRLSIHNQHLHLLIVAGGEEVENKFMVTRLSV